MNPKTPVVLLLLSIFSVYFLCPVLCPSLETRSCSVFAGSQATSQGVADVSQFAETRANSATCCRTKTSESSPTNNPGEENDNCCFDRLEIFDTSEYPRSAPTLEQSFPLVAAIASCIDVNAFPTDSAEFLDRYPISYLDPPSYQISPRAPPFAPVKNLHQDHSDSRS